MYGRNWWDVRAEAGADGGDGGGGAADSAASGGGTIVDDAGKGGEGAAGDGKTPPAAADWPDDWRNKASAGDAKKMARLQRYASPVALVDAFIATQNKIFSGEFKASLGKDAKPEELAAYREAHGIPESADKYDLTGIEVDATQKPLVDKFLGAAHGAHMTPDQVRASLAAYTEITETAKAERLKLDSEIKTTNEDKLRAEWGGEFRVNLNLITNLLDGGPVGLREQLLHGRLADGTPIGSSPEVLQFLVGLARERNPAGIVAPSGSSSLSSVADELETIRKVMREDRRRYNGDEKMQARYRELVEWEARQKSRSA